MLLRYTFVLLLMFIGGATSAWGQTDFSGTYYMAMPGTGSYDDQAPASNYYLVPTKDWCYFVAPNTVQYVDNGQPFLTTYKCGHVKNAKWTIQKHETENKYYIIHVADGKYLTYNSQISGATGANRARVHLQDSKTDDGLFTITNSGVNYFISHEKNWYLNVTDGNKDSYAGATGKTDGPVGPNGDTKVGGIIGRWSESNNTSQFRLELTTSIDAPTITNNNDGTFTITAATGATIYYTTDGTEPTTSTPTTGTTSVNVSQTESMTVIKAIAKAASDAIATEVTTYELPTCDAPVISFESSTSMVSITGIEGSTIYYTTNGNAPTTSDDEYLASFSVTEATTVKAIAIKPGTVSSTVAELTISQVATPTIQKEGNTISITTTTPDATIYYTTNGTDPSTSSTEYTSPLTDEVSGLTIKAIAVKENMITSEVCTELLPCAVPVISFDDATSKVSIISATVGGTIYYTTDGTTPTTSSTEYSSPFSVNSTTTVKAITAKSGYESSTVAESTFYQVATPTIQKDGENNAISITTTTPDATIYYTTDGSTPTTLSTEYTEPLTEDVSNVTIKAIAVKAGMITSAVGSGQVKLQCATPVITRDGMTFTLSCSKPTDATLYYTLGSNPEQEYTGTPVSFTSDELPMTVTAVARHSNYTQSETASMTLTKGSGTPEDPYMIYGSTDFTDFVNNVNFGTTASACYKLGDDVDASGIGAITKEFTGSFDGGGYTISNLGHALFYTVSGGVVKNVILDDVSISGGTNAGAIANLVTGTSDHIGSIYNCGVLSGSVSGSGYVGSIVGQLGDSNNDNCYARVINCFSYAEVSGGSEAGGIVGYNSYASKAGDIRTMVMNCMFYGDITSGTNVSPVFGGNNIANLKHDSDRAQDGLNTFNYYAYDETTTFNARAEGATKKYNSALAVEKKFLNRFEYYRLLLNSNKKLAAFYATGSPDNADQKMMKWVLETADRSIAEPKPYPILKAQDYYPSIINYDVENAPDSTSVGRNHGGKLGKTLSVTIKKPSEWTNAPSDVKLLDENGDEITTSRTFPLQRTDKDFDRFNFNYDKVQLPYYNDYGTKNYTDNKVVTGWKITAITAVDGDPYTAANYPTTGITDFPNHNYADRKSSNKDLYSVSNRVFSQGAYFDVPYGVTAITIEPYWGNAAYVADEYMDVVYNTGYSAQSVTQLGRQFGANKTSVKINGSDQIVYTSISEALKDTHLTGTTVYDNAVVLVGNLHQGGVPSNGSKAFTIMSVDLNHDNEPDCSMIYHHDNRQQVCPIRFDFINIPGTAQAQKPNGADKLKNFTIFLMKGWFETTNTCIVYSNQVEYENKQNNTTKVDAPLILLGGEFEQFVSTRAETVDGKTYYIHVGGNVKIDNFGLGTHSDGSQSTPHVPVSVTGGEFKGFYLTGTYNPNATEREDNAECYISGGHFVEAAGACQEPIKGDVHWQIYNADIDAFYGGGINDARPIKGTITTDIYNSHVTLFCGGPKFGNMTSGKAVTTNAEGCVFDEYFGAGYGGLSYSRQKYIDESNFKFGSNPYTGDKEKYFDGQTTNANNSHADYGKKGPGVAIDFDYEFFVWSTGVTGARMYVKFASFSLAQCDNVFSNLKGCTVNHNFYGGGSLGKVTGTATSVLENCTVHGNVFGGGYSGTLPTLEVRDGGFTKIPKFNSNSGIFEPGEFSGTTTYTWKNAEEAGVTLTNGGDGSDKTNHYIYTNQNLTVLGQVGETDLTIKGNTSVEGSVFGGGDESAITASATATGNTKVTIEENDTHETPTVNNVYGGGNTADVLGDAEVRMTSGTVSQDIYGGGKGETTTVSGNVTVNIGAKADGGALSGSGTVIGNVYGGSALGDVNATKEEGYNYADDPNAHISATTGKETKVNVYGGTVSGCVFGGGRGDLASLGDGHSNIDARNFGPTSVNMEGGTVSTAVYGGSNVNGVLKDNAAVTITSGTIGTSGGDINDVVFGGGFGAPTLVNGNVTVNVGTMTPATPPAAPTYTGTAIVNGHVYGGGALGNTNVDWVTDDSTEPATTTLQPVVGKNTLVNLYAGTINGYAYGGGLGNADTPAYVGGDVTVTLDGAKVQQVFGANNINGTPKGHVLVHVKRTVDSAKPTVDGESKPIGRDGRTTYDVEAVYGGGNKADYIPTDAANGFAEVLIEGCEKTSIKHVYGGGNAAAVPATDVTVKGTYIINTLYGGGNGAGAGNLGANVGYRSYSSLNPTDEEKTSKQYGTGKAVTKLLGGYINDVYGGSNTKGDVRGGTDVRTKGKTEVVTGDCCSDLNVGNVYGAGSHADVKSDVKIILECMPDDFVDAVYGGAEEATIDGNVTLTVTSGKFGRVFGGNNKGGNIKGSITVNIYEDGCEPLIIGEVYGGGNAAPYSIYGCTKDEGTGKWTPNTTGDLNFNQETEGRAAIQVNIQACTSVGKVFGGGMGATAKVIGNTNVDVNLLKGWIDDPDHPGQRKQNPIGKVAQVYGGGGEADVIGNTLVEVGTKLANEGEDEGVNITSGTDYLDPSDGSLDETITAGIYGGGYSADVDGNTTLNIGTKDQRIGEDPSVMIAGDIFGGGYGATTHVTGDVVVNIGKRTNTALEGDPVYAYEGYANITGDVYGGSAQGKVNSHLVESVETASEGKTTHVNLYGGEITGNIHGGGLGASAIAADVYGPVTVDVYGGTVNNVFGCNNVNGTPKSTVTVNINNGAISQSVYGGGNQAVMDGSPVVNVFAGTIGTAGQGGAVYGNVYGGGLGSDGTGSQTAVKKVMAGLVKGNTNVTVSGGTILHNIYGGGAYGSVGTYSYNESTGAISEYTSGGKATIHITGGTIGTDGKNNGMVFGSSRGDIDEPGAIQDHMAWVYDTEVVIGQRNDATAGPQINGSIYGSGENGHTYRDASVTIYSGKIGITNTGTDDGANYGFRGNVYGGGCGTDKYYSDPSLITGTHTAHDGYGNKYNITAGIVNGNATVTIYGGHVVRNVYGAGAMGSVTGKTIINISGNSEIGTEGFDGGDVFAAARGETDMEAGYATVGSTELNISNGLIWGSAFGGGQLGTVKGSVAVNVSGGVIKEDVYGGGALANTNTDNWTGDDGIPSYVAVTGLATETYRVKEMAIGASVAGLYTYNSGTSTYVAADGTAIENVVYYERLSGAPVAGYYTESAGNYTRITNSTTTADGGTTYYKKVVAGSWADGKNDPSTGTTYKTTVSLTGGLVGNVYGGGLGNTTTMANVYGDVTVTVNQGVEDETKGVAFTQQLETATIGETVYPTPVPVSGRVFGGNNHNGTPTGNITVHVYSTRQLDKDDNILPGHGSPDRKYSYDIQSVYGGGNQADYLPADGKKSHVIIDGCNETSIEKVYGGGNSAVIPETDVLINGAYDIGYAFGGGNGDKPIKKDDGSWQENEGAIVIGLASIVCQGGKIGQVFGGGDAKGSCGNTNAVTKQVGDCPLHITRLYGAGNKGDVSSVNIVLAACSENAIDYVHGGSYNAHVHGDVHLTITSGVLKNVYGGNDARGGIEGNIIVDIEETHGCNPIIIQNLVGGGNEAPYPGTKTNNEGVEVPIGTHGIITVNVKSATRIDNIYGGSYLAEADADTEVNINMIKGNKAGETVDIPKEFSYIPNITKLSDNPDGKTIRCQINNAIGTIGNVYGGGNLGLVNGKTTVNIGASDHVEIMARDANGKILDVGDHPLDIEDGKNITPEIASTIKYNSIIDATSHLGAHITGSVYGGGREADVTGNTYVNICAKESATPGTYEAVAEGSDKVTIAGNVYGGGKGAADSFTCEKAMVGIVDDGATVDGEGESATYTLKEGGTTVTIGHGTVGTLDDDEKLVEGTGNVYGGGEIGRVERNTKVTIGIGNGTGGPESPVIEGEVYGAGQGIATHGYAGLVRGNSTVTIQGDSWVKQSVYGAGKLASLGRFKVAQSDDEVDGVEKGMPYKLLSGGQSSVTIQGYAKIGPEAAMTMPTFSGNVFGAGKGLLPYDVVGEPGRYYYDNGTYTWESYADPSKEGAYLKYVETLGITHNTIVTIGGNAFVMGSVYGGSENGSVFAGTVVNISGGQIGAGDGINERYTDSWPTDASAIATSWAECAHWPYEAPYAPYDKYARADGTYENGQSSGGGLPATGSAGQRASDGHTFYGNVFGGGSGKDPYKPGKWHRKAGYVGGNTVVNITDGHILTSVYGGNEHTDVGSGEDMIIVSGKGKCTVNMTGGTLGVPRTVEDAKAHPVTCYLFGAGKGDQRTFFNTWTNVSETEVNVTGTARIYGSVFGGGEDGHVLGDAKVIIGGSVKIDLNNDGDTDDSGETFTAQSGLKIGTTGTSYVDGNVFGGGRGFSGDALTAGTVGGNVDVTISGGTMLGSIYGGGRLASVGAYFTAPEADEYGQLQEDTDENGNGVIDVAEKKHGHITVAISGGTIGNAEATGDGAEYSGNVYGGCMGRTTLMDGETINPIWPELAQSKFTTVTISGSPNITRNVYGGGEFGVVRENATVTLNGGTIGGYVYGGGHGSADYQHPTTIEVHWGGETRYFTYTPMQWTGCVGGNTTVNLAGGTVKRIYGGGELASVGVIDYSVTQDDANGEFTYDGHKYAHTNLVKHDSKTTDDNTFYDFGLSWPYKFTYVPCNLSGFIGGLATVNVTGGTVTEYVYGGGKGQVAFTGVNDIEQQRYVEAFCANVRNTQVTIGTEGGSGDTPTIGTTGAGSLGSVYGGGEDGHVYEDTQVTIHRGTIAHTVFGGGKGTSTFKAKLLDPDTGEQKADAEDVYSWTAGKVYGNTKVTMNGGSVGWFVYGGGNMASVGKGNYTGGSDDYSTTGYGELPSASDDDIWTASPAANTYADYFQNSGKATVTILGGTVGTATAGFEETDKLPYGSVFGGSRGKSATDNPNVLSLFPLYKYLPDFYLGYANKTVVNVGGTTASGAVTGDGPTIYGSIYGGAQDGHVRNSTEVRVFKGSVAGQTSDEAGRSGHVFGAGSGIGTYVDSSDSKNKVSNSSGSVTGTTLVELNGGSIHGNIYGGGAMATVGPPKITQDKDEQHSAPSEGTQKSVSYTRVDVKGGTVGGSVFGASRGPSDAFLEERFTDVGVTYDASKFATDLWSDVNISGGTVTGNVYGGGETGEVKCGVTVNVTGGTINGDVYGGGALANTNTSNVPDYASGGTTPSATNTYTTTVYLNGGLIHGDAYGGGLGRKESGTSGEEGYIAPVEATVFGDINVCMGGDATHEMGSATDVTAFNITYYTGDHSSVVKSGRVFGSNNQHGSPRGNVTVTVWKTTAGNMTRTTPEAKASNKTIMDAHPDNYKEIEGYIIPTYEVAAVYGGGNLAPYETHGKKTHVIINGCQKTSIMTVYGGGNAAIVPEASVDVNGTYEIGSVFGGGNGSDPYTLDGSTWKDNPGADVNGNATTMLYGGTIHEAYGGSNTKGKILGSVIIDAADAGIDPTDSSYCELDIVKIVAAGKNDDVGDLIVVMECKPSTFIPLLYGGADNANVNGNVELTITSGNFGKVFGGNNMGGAIRGHIQLNIEETGTCETPITIEELYLGGMMAAYSRYGYYVKTTTSEGDSPTGVGDPSETAVLDDADRLVFMPRKSADDPHLPVDTYSKDDKTWTVKPITGDGEFVPYDQPELNVISCTSIGEVFGGGYGERAVMYADPTVNINMIPGSFADNATVGVPAVMTEKGLNDSDNPDHLGIIGNVYGGGNEADVIGNPTVNIATVDEVKLHLSYNKSTGYNMSGNQTVKGAFVIGDVFGGGKGIADSFTCEKAMIGKEGDGVDHPAGGTHVNIYNGTVLGSVYGGGMIGRVEKNTVVTIGKENAVVDTSKPIVKGDVFGGGKGDEEHGYAALVRGNPTVTIQADAKVLHSVYGGGEIASVARYKVVDGVPVALVGEEGHYSGYCTVNVLDRAIIGPDTHMKMYHEDVAADEDAPDDAGHVFAAGKGVLPKVYTYADNEHRPRRMMAYDASKFNDSNSAYWEYSDNTHNNVWQYFKDENEYFDFVQTLALATQTEATISGNAFVKGSVYGGSENGIVQYDTHVTIAGNCQIGCGKNTTNRHPDEVWAAGYASTMSEGTDLECASWEYGIVEDGKTIYAPYDPYANATGELGEYPSGESTEGGRKIASDGHTYYGNVFGGGSGSVPYFDTHEGVSRYIMTAGQVKGNTAVTISGGHILTNVYGGNEATNVNGKATVTMTGGTIGVPRTLTQIANHPVTCYLFGAGKGDQRVFFNKDTNVGNVEVNVTGGWIYGSVFGGGEDGHVMGNVTMKIGGTAKIGTWGTSYVDGNVFGGGRGFGGDAYTAGNVAGSVDMTISGGTMLGSIYGGGRLGSVGYGLYKATEIETDGHKMYGEMQDDGYGDWYKNESDVYVRDAIDGFKRGHVEINITGGTIGNDLEYKYYTFDVATNDKTVAQIEDAKKTAVDGLKAQQVTDHIPNTEFEIADSIQTGNTRTYTYRLKHTKGGNVFAGGMGRLYQLDNTTPITSVDWWRLGNVKSTKLTISGTAKIKSNVYGGGELGLTQTTDSKDKSTEIAISGENVTVGTEITDGSTTKYTFGSVFGGGYGSTIEYLSDSDDPKTSNDNPKYIAGRVFGKTSINMENGKVLGSVYGGGEVANVGRGFYSFKTLKAGTGESLEVDESGNGIDDVAFAAEDVDNVSTSVTISGGTIGKEGFGGPTMGNVYGGGSGSNEIVRCGIILGNTNVTISGDNTKIYHNVYGGGAYGSVGDFKYHTEADAAYDGAFKVSYIEDIHTRESGITTVNITGGTIGVDGHENGMVFGSSRGDVYSKGRREDYMAWVNNSHITIGSGGTGPAIKGSVYGSGENGHTFTDTEVIVHGGTIGVADGASYPYRGNVYGGGCGTDMLDSDDNGSADSYNALAGVVYGNSKVTIDGGHVVRNVYGAGAMGSVGKATTDDNGKVTIASGGTTTIAISGGTIGVSGSVGDGNVFGAARGDKASTQTGLALVKTTGVTISGTAAVKGNVYGGGENGDVQGNTAVAMQGGTVAKNVFGGGKGDGGLFTCAKAMVGIEGEGAGADLTTGENKVKGTSVTISNGTVGTLDDNNKLVAGTGNVYGGGEIGRVEWNTHVTVGSGDGTPVVEGSVFGAGKGLETHGYSALVRGNSTVTIQGTAKIGENVYGGGEMATVGRYWVNGRNNVDADGKLLPGAPEPPEHLPDGMPYQQQSGGICTVTIQGSAQVGPDAGASETAGHVFGAGQGVVPHFSDGPKRKVDDGEPVDFAADEIRQKTAEEVYNEFLETLALVTNTNVTVDGSAQVKGNVYGGSESGFVQHDTYVTVQNGTIGSSGSTTFGKVFGGGKGLSLTEGMTFTEAGKVKENTTVNILGGTVYSDVYGGGALGKSNTNVVNNAYPTATVNLLGGIITGSAYGGGLGDATTAANVGNTVVNLNGMDKSFYDAADATMKTVFDGLVNKSEGATTYPLKLTKTGCIVDRIFGANNVNGTPEGHAKVHVLATQNANTSSLPSIDDKSEDVYDMNYVFGGGNASDYVPASTDAQQSTEVIIEGCDLTSIREVYGGGYGAAVPGTEILIKGTYLIDNVFGGGFGASTETYTNPGANVGYRTGGTTAYGVITEDEAYKTANVKLMAGRIHHVYGASNTKGDIRGGSLTTTVEKEEPMGSKRPICENLIVDDIHGGGQDAPMAGGAEVVLGCMPNDWIDEVYAGAANADVGNDVSLTITSGKFGRVFGGNKSGGRLHGSIVVNIEENPACGTPIIIGELYGGGNDAPYSIYGYKDEKDENGKWKPREKSEYDAMTLTDPGKAQLKAEGIEEGPHQDPRVNVKAFTSIGNIYGGGYGINATVVGNPTVNINEVEVTHTDTDAEFDGNAYNPDADTKKPLWIDGTTVKLWPHEDKKMGVIGNVFGGGNAAQVIGNTNVNIGTELGNPIRFESLQGYYKVNNENVPVKGADIRGNVYGGGNNAKVTGDTNVVIGRKD